MARVPLRDGQRLHVRVLGRGQPVLMLHGMSMSGNHWLPFILPHLHRHRFYLPDLRGAGGSASVPFKQGDIFQAHAEDVEDVISHFDLRDIRLVGISLGATASLHLQRLGGFNRVARYLHIDQSPCIGNRDDWPHGLFGARQPALFAQLRQILAILARHPQARRFADLPQPDRGEAGEILSEVLALMAGGSGTRTLMRRVLALPPMLLSRLPVPMTDLVQMRTYLSAYVAGGHDYRPTLARDAVPVTLMLGAHSPLYAEAGQREVARHHPASRVVRFTRSGHVPLKDEPLRFLRELGRFLDAR